MASTISSVTFLAARSHGARGEDASGARGFFVRDAPSSISSTTSRETRSHRPRNAIHASSPWFSTHSAARSALHSPSFSMLLSWEITQRRPASETCGSPSCASLGGSASDVGVNNSAAVSVACSRVDSTHRANALRIRFRCMLCFPWDFRRSATHSPTRRLRSGRKPILIQNAPSSF